MNGRDENGEETIKEERIKGNERWGKEKEGEERSRLIGKERRKMTSSRSGRLQYLDRRIVVCLCLLCDAVLLYHL